MARRLFFVDAIRRGRAEVEGEQAYHLARVLRVEPGTRLEISDNRAVYLAQVESARKDRVVFEVIEPVEREELPVRITLLAALIKFDRFEWMVEKATELGVERLVPVAAGRTEKGLAAAAVRRRQRWLKIALESSQQARRTTLPVIEPAAAFETAVAAEAGVRLLLDEARGAPPLAATVPAPPAGRTAALLVGPEGGWTEAERLAAAAAGWAPVSLGPCILRAETAALAAVAGVAVLAGGWTRALQT